ncbi:hypothetical protein STCU_02918 [Strigomonas culicis]|uniref:Uncharacterized protein n=1 Tax=Strigomonas culicis TaxID=28005 RepID=S9UTT7_9TRYP|nr:hypothetical protein STCU_02918 [Strigomonas culicis]|eukprot:EPY32224.1 hypothetical protein STCU_02918 [Strigomonas culicis]
MALLEIVVFPRYTILPVVLIILYMAGMIISIINTSLCFQKRKATLGTLSSAHLAFCVIGAPVCFCFSCVMWLWSSRYSVSHPDRIWRLTLGVWAVWALKDFPLVIIEIMAIMRIGFSEHDLQSASFVIQVIFAFFSTLATSATYAWYLAGLLERSYGERPTTAYRGGSLSLPAAAPPLMLRDRPYELPTFLPGDTVVFPYSHMQTPSAFHNAYQDALFGNEPQKTPLAKTPLI